MKESAANVHKDFEYLQQISDLSNENNLLKKENEVLRDQNQSVEKYKLEVNEL